MSCVVEPLLENDAATSCENLREGFPCRLLTLNCVQVSRLVI